MFRKANLNDVSMLQKILSDTWRVTYQDLYSVDYIERVIEKYYNIERLKEEVTQFSKAWSGYYIYEVAGKIVGCIGGGIEAEQIGHIYVLYLDPTEKRKGYGRKLVAGFTKVQKEEAAISEQRVSVSEGNEMGLPFYAKMGFEELYRKQSSEATEEEGYQSLILSRVVN